MKSHLSGDHSIIQSYNKLFVCLFQILIFRVTKIVIVIHQGYNSDEGIHVSSKLLSKYESVDASYTGSNPTNLFYIKREISPLIYLPFISFLNFLIFN